MPTRRVPPSFGCALAAALAAGEGFAAALVLAPLAALTVAGAAVDGLAAALTEAALAGAPVEAGALAVCAEPPQAASNAPDAAMNPMRSMLRRLTTISDLLQGAQ
ncbi:MAG: hypothetical protein JO247_20890 [Chloroflexi bacterium]|nr:hypothetical protein [Chloroflexota bacterium]